MKEHVFEARDLLVAHGSSDESRSTAEASA